MLNVNVKPKAKKNALLKEENGYLKLSIKAPPEDGKANNELISFLAKLFGVTQSKIKLIRGRKSRYKQFLIENPKHSPIDSIVLNHCVKPSMCNSKIHPKFSTKDKLCK